MLRLCDFCHRPAVAGPLASTAGLHVLIQPGDLHLRCELHLFHAWAPGLGPPPPGQVPILRVSPARHSP